MREIHAIRTTCPRCKKEVNSYDVSHGWEEPAKPGIDKINVTCYHFSCNCGFTWAEA